MSMAGWWSIVSAIFATRFTKPMLSEKDAKAYVFTSTSPRRDHPVKRPSARCISRSESFLRMERRCPEVGTPEILVRCGHLGHEAAGSGAKWMSGVARMLALPALAALVATSAAAQATVDSGGAPARRSVGSYWR